MFRQQNHPKHGEILIIMFSKLLIIYLHTFALWAHETIHCGQDIENMTDTTGTPDDMSYNCLPGTFPYCWASNSDVCIKNEDVCDGWEHCPRGEDEWTCKQKAYEPCSPGYTKCGNTNRCVPNTKRCDNVKDCPGGEDEAGCPPNFPQPPNCPAGMFGCDGICKPAYIYCNHRVDCFDGTDEPAATTTCEERRVYQVNNIAVNNGKDDYRLPYHIVRAKWWMDSLVTNDTIQFLPQVCEDESSICINATSWTSEYFYELNNKTMPSLLPWWEYSISVFVKRGLDTYLPGVIKSPRTRSSKPGRPYNVKVAKQEGEIVVTWDRPSYINGKFGSYSIQIDPEITWPWDHDAYDPRYTIPLCYRSVDNDGIVHCDPVFQEGNEYTFTVSTNRWVSSWDPTGQSQKSSPGSIMLHMISPLSNSIVVDGETDNQVSLKWDTVGGSLDSYNVTVDSMDYNKRVGTFITKEKKITVKDLNPQTAYNVTITPILLGQAGDSSSISLVRTTGERPSKVEGFSAACEGPAAGVGLTWTTTSVKSQYIILIWKNEINLFPEEKIGEDGRLHLDHLESCETYIFEVFAKEGSVNGTPTGSPIAIKTGFNKLSPPKDIRVAFWKGEPMKIAAVWESSCPILTESVDYIIRLTELESGFVPVAPVKYISVKGGKNSTHIYEFPRSYGSRYTMEIKTDVDGCNFSSKYYFQEPIIPRVEELRQLPDVMWVVIDFTAPILPPLILRRGSPVYQVWISTNPEFQGEVLKYILEKKPFKRRRDGFKVDVNYYAAIVVQDGSGRLSPPSDGLQLDTDVTLIHKLLDAFTLLKGDYGI